MYIAKTAIGFIEIPNKVVCNIYAVGCEHNCKGCHVPHLQSKETCHFYYLTETAFMEKLKKCDDLVDGICWLGGDALFQEVRLVELSELFKQVWPDRFNAIYTGFKFEDINPHLLEYMDIVIDGKWEGIPVTDKNTNQKIWVKGSDGWSLCPTYNEFQTMELTTNT